MNKKRIALGILVLIGILAMSNLVNASGLSVQLKRTNPGIADVKPAELIFDVVNTDMTHNIEGFIWCKSPDDVTVSSTMGVASGSGAQYVSQKFFMDEGPSQKAISLVIDAETKGDKRTGCIIKYVPYKEISKKIEDVTTVTETVTKQGIMFRDVKMKMAEINESNVTATLLVINGEEHPISSGDLIKFDNLRISIEDIEEDYLTVEISEKVETTELKKMFLTMNGRYVEQLKDSQYREIRLDKTLPFIEAPGDTEVSCPKEQTHCKSDEVETSKERTNYLKYSIMAGLAVVFVMLVYMLGRGSRNKGE